MSPRDFIPDKKKTSCREWFATLVIDPMNRTRIAFEIFMGLIYMICYILDPYIFSLRFKPLQYTGVHVVSETCTVFIILEILLLPFMGIKKEDRQLSTNEKKYEKKDNGK